MAKKAKEPRAAKPGKAERKAAKADAPPKRKGALMDRATNLVAVLFALSLAAERVVAG